MDFCRLAVKLYQKVQPNASAAPEAAFSDCENESVCLAAALGIVTGYDDGTFRPYSPSPVRRPQRWHIGCIPRSVARPGAANDKPRTNITQLGDWARSSVYAMREIGIMQSKNNRFRPKDGYTQERAVVTVERAFQAVNCKLQNTPMHIMYRGIFIAYYLFGGAVVSRTTNSALTSVTCAVLSPLIISCSR